MKSSEKSKILSFTDDIHKYQVALSFISHELPLLGLLIERILFYKAYNPSLTFISFDDC